MHFIYKRYRWRTGSPCKTKINCLNNCDDFSVDQTKPNCNTSSMSCKEIKSHVLGQFYFLEALNFREDENQTAWQSLSLVAGLQGKKKYKEEKKAEKKTPPSQTQYHLSYIQVLLLEIVWSLQQTHSLPGFTIGVLQYGSGFLQLLPVTMTWEIWTHCIQ